MGLFKRAILSLTRNRKKSLILLVVLFILGSVLSGAIAINQGAMNVERFIKQRIAPVLTIQVDEEAANRKRLEDDTFRLPNLSADIIEQIGQASQVKAFDYSAFPLMVGSEQLKPWIDQALTDGYQTTGLWDFSLKGVQHTPMMLLETGAAEFTSGRAWTRSEIDQGASQVIISKELAERNQLSTGDGIVVESNVVKWSTVNEERVPERVESVAIPLEIIGIIEYTASKESGEKVLSRDMERANTLLIPNRLLIEERKRVMEAERSHKATLIDEAIPAEGKYQAFFLLENLDHLPAFVTENEALLPEYYQLRANSDTYSAVSSPINQISDLAKYVLQITVGATILVIGLITVLFLRDRRHEIGIYLALGEKRLKVIGQIILEVMLISSLAMLLSLASGQLIAGFLSESLVRDQLVAEIDHEAARAQIHDQLTFGEYASAITPMTLAENYQINYSFRSAMQTGLVILGSSLIATMMPIGYILQFSPRKIMQK